MLCAVLYLFVKDFNYLGISNAGARAFQIYLLLMEELRNVTERPVVFAIDEHNEIFKLKGQNHPIFRDYTISTGLTSGVCILTFIFVNCATRLGCFFSTTGQGEGGGGRGESSLSLHTKISFETLFL